MFGPADFEPELQEDDAIVHDHVFEFRQLAQELRALIGGAEAEDMLDHRAVVPAAVEQRDLAPSGQPVDVALEIPLRGFAVGGFGQGNHGGDAGVQVLGQRLDGAALAGSVAALEQHHQTLAGGFDVGLHLDQLDLQRLHSGVVVLALHLFVIGVGLGQDVVLAAFLDRLSHLFRGAFAEIAADCAVKGQVHGVLRRVGASMG